MISFWVELGAVAIYAAVLFLIAKGPFEHDPDCECRECCDTMARLEVLILEVLDDCPCEDDAYLNQPVREALPLDEYQRDAEIRKLETWAGR